MVRSSILVITSNKFWKVPSVAEWSKALESDASASGESSVRAQVRAATPLPLRVMVCVFMAGTAQRPDSVSGWRGPCPVYRARKTFG